MSHPLMRFAGYFLYTILMACVIIKGVELEKYLEEQKSITFSAYPYFAYLAAFPVFIGILLALPNFIQTLNRPGVWRFDWVKFLAIGIPTFYITMLPTVFFTPVSQYLPKFSHIFFMHSLLPQQISGIVFGYVLFSAFYKEIPSRYSNFF